jgi:uncharacterized Zn-binding protein involved in type VI secretion/nucleoid-associated protein YgaU
MTAHGGIVTSPGCTTVMVGKMPAARMTDMHVCPMVTPPAIPHVGMLHVGPVPPTVLIGKLPAACVGDMFICTGPPSTALPPGCLTVMFGQSGAGGGGGGGSGPSDASSSSTLSAKKPSSIKALAAMSIEVQQQLGDVIDYMTPEQIELATQVYEAAAKEKSERPKGLTLKDFVDILKQVESNDGYEAARFFAGHLDYGAMTGLARGFVDNTEPDGNDPNQMPTRFMLLFGMDDAKLQSQDDHPDKFDGEDHKVNIKNLRKGLRLLGYSVKEDGPYDKEVYAAHMQYLSGSGSDTDDIPETYVTVDGDDLGALASRFGMVSWKYLYEKNKDAIGDNPDLLKPGIELTIPQWDATSGDELIGKKNADPFDWVGGCVYRYPWVPYSVTLVDKDGDLLRDKDSSGNAKEKYEESKKYKVTQLSTGKVLVEGEIDAAENLEVLVPDAAEMELEVDGIPYSRHTPQETA